MITNLGHIAYSVKDLDATLHFYCDQLGFEKMFQLKNDDGTVWIQYVKVAHGQYIEFFPEDKVEWNDYASYRHLALETDDIRGDVEKLRAAGVKINVEPNEGLDGAIQAWISDPDGNPIELMQLQPHCLHRVNDPE